MKKPIDPRLRHDPNLQTKDGLTIAMISLLSGRLPEDWMLEGYDIKKQTVECKDDLISLSVIIWNKQPDKKPKEVEEFFGKLNKLGIVGKNGNTFTM